jgi:hypothetical protein
MTFWPLATTGCYITAITGENAGHLGLADRRLSQPAATRSAGANCSAVACAPQEEFRLSARRATSGSSSEFVRRRIGRPWQQGGPVPMGAHSHHLALHPSSERKQGQAKKQRSEQTEWNR